MSTSAIQDALRRRPFEPFRIRLSSGDSYEVCHPEKVLLLRGGVYVALGVDCGLPERAVYCSLLHIAAIETVAAA